MAYLTGESLQLMGFESVGRGVKISDKASIYNAESIRLGDYSRIDDFCVLSGSIDIGKYCHITPMCLIAGGSPGVHLGDFCTLAYGVKIFAQSDDYSGHSMVNSLIPKKYKNELLARVVLKNQVILGANVAVLPGVVIEEGCSVGAMTLVSKSTEPWGIYVGNPARRIKDRKKDLLALEKKFLQEKED